MSFATDTLYLNGKLIQAESNFVLRSGEFVTTGQSGVFATAQNLGLTGAALLSKEIGFAVDSSTAVATVGVNKNVFLMPYNMILTGVIASLIVPATGANFIIDLNKSGISVLSGNRITIPTGASGVLTGVVITGSTLPFGSRISADIDQVGATYAGLGPTVWMLGKLY